MTTAIEYSQILDEIAKSADWHESLDSVSISRINQAAQGLRELDKPDCVWTNSDSDEEFETQCGNAFTFIDGGIKENDCKFCQYCGGAVKEST